MPNNQCSFSYASPMRNLTATYYQSANPYAALVAPAGLEHDGRSSSCGSPPSSGSSASFAGYSETLMLPQTPSRSQVQTNCSLRTSQQPPHNIYGSPEQDYSTGLGSNDVSICTTRAAHSADHRSRRTGGHASVSTSPHAPTSAHRFQPAQSSSLTGVPESVAVQEMAFRTGQRDSSSAFDNAATNPFARQFDQLWAAFYKLGQKCGGQPTPIPANASHHNFAWVVLINPRTQSLEYPNGTLDPVWTRKMIQVALNCMAELIRVTCRRNTGWDKTVVDIPLPAQEALAAFPDLAQQYEMLQRDAKEARAGGRPYGY